MADGYDIDQVLTVVSYVAVLAAFLAEQALAIDAGEDGGRFATYVKALPRRTGGVLDWPEDDIKLVFDLVSEQAPQHSTKH